MIETSPVGATALRDSNERHPILRTTLIGIMAFLTVVDLFATQAILPYLQARYDVTPAAMGVAVNASTLGMAIASLGVAFFSRRIDRRKGVIVALTLLAVPTVLLAHAPDLASFAALRVAQGLCMASAFTLSLAYLGESISASRSASAFAAYITGNVASNFFGRFLSASLADGFGLDVNFYAFAALNLAGAALVAVVMRDAAPASAAGASDRNPFRIWGRHLSDPLLRGAFLVGFCILFAFIGTFTYVGFVLAREPIAIERMTLGYVYFVFLPSVVTTPQAGKVIDRFGVRKSMAGSLVFALMGLPLLLAPSLPAVLAGLTIVAIGTFFAQATATSFVGKVATVDRGAASGLYLASYFSGGLVGSAVLGLLFDRFGWGACVAGIGAALILAAGVAWSLRRRTRAGA